MSMLFCAVWVPGSTGTETLSLHTNPLDFRFSRWGLDVGYPREDIGLRCVLLGQANSRRCIGRPFMNMLVRPV